MSIKRLAQIFTSVAIALVAGFLLRPEQDNCHIANLDAILTGGELELAEDCMLILDTQREIRGDVRITGGMLHSGGLDRLLYVHRGATLTLQNVTVLSGASDIGERQGGGMYNAGTAHIIESKFLSNLAREGGAIYSTGTLLLRDSVIARNTAVRGAGIYIAADSNALIYNTLIDDNGVRGGMGGGIYNAGEATIQRTTIRNNRAASAETGGDRGSAAGIYNDAKMMIQQSIIEGNTALYSAGIGNSDNGDLTVIRSEIVGNVARVVNGYGGYGGGLNNRNLAVIAETRIAENSANEGAGIDNNGALVMTHSIIENNHCTGEGCKGVGFLAFGGVAQIRHNYWGAADGPSEDGAGSGDGIAGVPAEQYTPFLPEYPAWYSNAG